jgi:diaminopimelate decarboxylase
MRATAGAGRPGRIDGMLELFPDGAHSQNGMLIIGGVAADKLLARHGSPLLVYDEATLRTRARAYRAAAPEALICFGTKAFPNLALLRLFADEGLGADVSTLGELRFALAAGLDGSQLVVHGNNKSDVELEAAAAEEALVVVDSLEEVDRARAAGVGRTLVRVTPGIEADTHAAIRTGQVGSKFGLAPDDALAALRRDPACEGLHVHIGSQLRTLDAARRAVEWIAEFAAGARDELGWEPRTLDLGGGLGVAATPDEVEISIADYVSGLLGALEAARSRHRLAAQRIILEPGRSLTARAGVTLYTVGSVKRSGASTFVAVDGGMSDNPRPALYGARYTALLANRADEAVGGSYAVVGRHCESGDLLIERVELPAPTRGDILAVPATGAYTLAMSSTYNALPRPAAVLVADGDSREIRRRETVEDLLGLEIEPVAAPEPRSGT